MTPLTHSSPSITIAVNGESVVVPAGLNLAGLLAHLGLPLDRVAVEVDRQIVRKPDWEAQAVVAGMQLEVVHFVGGG